MISALFPIFPIERENSHRLDGGSVQAPHVDAEAIRIGARHVIRFAAAIFAEVVLGNAGVERIGSQRVCALNQAKCGRRNNQMKKPRALAHRTVAFMRLDIFRGGDLDDDGPAMTATGVLHVWPCAGSQLPLRQGGMHRPAGRDAPERGPPRRIR